MDMYPSVDDCQNIVQGLFSAFKGIPRFQKHIGNHLWEHGYVETFLGYRRYLPGLRDVDTKEQNRALRQAYNSPIQGSAGDITKVAMNNIYNAMGRGEISMDDVMIIATIHDEVLFEVKHMPLAELEEVVDKLVKCMEVTLLPGLSIGQVAEPEVADHHNLYGAGANHWGQKRDFHQWANDVRLKELDNEL